MRPLNRITPILPPQAMQTYHIARPVETHFRKATCREAGCGAYERGWMTTVDTSTDLGRKQAYYIRMKSGRKYEFTEQGTLIEFRFPAGQRCFGEHQIPTGREPIFALTGGDWRGNPRGTRTVRFSGHRQYIDDMGETLDRLADRRKRG